jgi:hypothetical protein
MPAKEVVAYFKRSGSNSELDHTLKQDICTRWNNQFFLLQSLATQLEDVKKILVPEKQFEKLELLNNTNEKFAHDLVNFLHVFHTATVQLSREKVPTAPDVWPMFCKLSSHSVIRSEDSENMRDLITAFLACLQEKYIVHPLQTGYIRVTPVRVLVICRHSRAKASVH